MLSNLFKKVIEENKSDAVVGLFFGIIIAPAAPILFQIGIQKFVDYTFGDNNYPIIWILLALVILNIGSLYSGKFIYRKIENRLDLSYKTSISEIFTRKLKRDNNLSRGEIIQTIEIIDDVVDFKKEKIMFLPLVISFIFIVLYFIFNLNGLYLLQYILYAIPIIIVLIVMTNIIGKYQKRVLEEAGKANDISTEIIEGFDIITNFRATDHFKDTFSRNNNYVRKFKNKINLTENIIDITTILINISLIIAMPLAASFLYKSGKITVGGIFIASSLIQQITEIISKIVGFFASNAKNKKYMELLNNIENSVVSTEGCNTAEINNFDKLYIKKLSFTYDDKNMILDSLSYEFEKNNIYIINGVSGIGKTTLIKLIVNELEIQSGEITLDNVNISPEIVKDLVSYSSQQSFLFHGNIEENIVYGINQDVNETQKKELVGNLEKVFNFDNIFKKEKALENIEINSQSDNISLGQKKLICLARTIIKDAKLVILDEPTANLNIRQVDIFKNELVKLKEDRIIIVITHDKRLNEIASRVLSIVDGVIVNEQ
jgi:ATP-binding cassette subfamily B protein